MKQGASETLDRDQQVLSRLSRIEHKVDSIEQTTAFALRADASKHFESVKEIFKRSRRRARVYLASDGQRTVQQIATHLRIKQPHVSFELRKLADEGVLEIIDTDGSSHIWGKKPLDRTLRITKFLCSEYGLTDDGQPKKYQKKTTQRHRN